MVEVRLALEFCPNHEGRCTRAFKIFGGPARALFVSPVMNDNVMLMRESERGRPTDPAARSGDDRNTAIVTRRG
jgi:hypothetical protein